MSDRESIIILLVAFLSFCGPILVAMVVLEFWGLGEYTRPILTPILVAIFAVSALVVAGISFIRRRLSSYAGSPPAYLSGTDSRASDGLEKLGNMSRSAQFTIPVRCPHCGKPIELDHAHWDGPMTLVCPECLGEVRVKVTE